MPCRAPNSRNARSYRVRRREHAQHERAHSIRDGGLDLRNPLLEAAVLDQRRELAEQTVERWHQNGTAPHVRDVGPGALAKPHEHAPLP
jgi:hypothetical protein